MTDTQSTQAGDSPDVPVLVERRGHILTIGINRARFWHVLDGFLTMPSRVDK